MPPSQPPQPFGRDLPPRLLALALRYKKAPSGIRDEAYLLNVCLECGTSGAEVSRINPFVARRRRLPLENRTCQHCFTRWYGHHCWNCPKTRPMSRVDSRDPETPPCERCGWYKCHVCTACHFHGCASNPFSFATRYREGAFKGQTIPEVLVAYQAERERREEALAAARKRFLERGRAREDPPDFWWR